MKKKICKRKCPYSIFKLKIFPQFSFLPHQTFSGKSAISSFYGPYFGLQLHCSLKKSGDKLLPHVPESVRKAKEKKEWSESLRVEVANLFLVKLPGSVDGTLSNDNNKT